MTVSAFARPARSGSARTRAVRRGVWEKRQRAQAGRGQCRPPLCCGAPAGAPPPPPSTVAKSRRGPLTPSACGRDKSGRGPDADRPIGIRGTNVGQAQAASFLPGGNNCRIAPALLTVCDGDGSDQSNGG
eukprot:gene25082-biopygen8990